jgi:hypothetical protein
LPPDEHPTQQRALRSAAVERVDDRLALDRHLVDGAPSEVDELFGMAHSELAAAAFVAGIRGCCGVSAAEGFAQRSDVDRAGPAAVADALELAVPSRCGQPDFDLDV